jgi:hypothetical protein
LEPRVGAYVHDFYLHWAVEEDLDRIDNLELSYMQIISPLVMIAQRAKKGGAHRLIAREQFRTTKEQSDWKVDGDFEDFADDDAPFDMLMGESYHWVIYYDGPGIIWTHDIDGGNEVVQALLSDPENTLIIAIENCRGFIYVLRSPHKSLGRLRMNDRYDHFNSGEHPFNEVAVFGDDHPEYQIVEAYSLPPDHIRYAAELCEREEGEARS